MFMGHYGPAVWDTQRGKGELLVTLWVGFLAVQFIALEIGLLLAGFLYWIRFTTGPKSSVVALSALFIFMVVIQFIFVTTPGLQVQAGTFAPNSGLQGVSLGASALFTFGLLTAAIAWIEKRRVSKASRQI